MIVAGRLIPNSRQFPKVWGVISHGTRLALVTKINGRWSPQEPQEPLLIAMVRSGTDVEE